MTRRFEELDRRPTPMGEISVRRRFHPVLQVDVFEVMLGDEHLMSNVFTAAEEALATLALAALDGDGLDVVVGGLGLGHTAKAALDDPRVRSVHVVEALDAVIEWHRAGLLPLSDELNADARCHYVHGDFFSLVAEGEGFGAQVPAPLDAVLVDIDHTPHHLLHPRHAPFYEREGLARLARLLRPGGAYGLWSDDPPDAGYVSVVEQVFGTCTGHEVRFPNPLTGGEASNTVYVAVAPG
jgi:spermidine synthase